jgi:uncharacterized protein
MAAGRIAMSSRVCHDGTFHEGELAVQRRAGVTDDAAPLARMLDTPDLSGGFSRFLADRTFVVLTARDGDGRLWTSPIFHAPGFVHAHGQTLSVEALPGPGDPLARLPAGQPAGLLAIEFATRRRVRVNGTLASVSSSSFEIAVDQAFGNCPKYIQARVLHPAPAVVRAGEAAQSQGVQRAHRDLIETADTFILGTVHPSRGADSSHRGGRPGFVRIEGGQLWWPDYAGNNMFNSLGNLLVNPEAALLFLDFRGGMTLHLSGTARLEWITPGAPGDDGGTGRRVRFETAAAVSGPVLGLEAAGVVQSPHNPPVRAWKVPSAGLVER